MLIHGNSYCGVRYFLHRKCNMKTTRASVEEFAKKKGYDPVQIDGIPEGFSWKAPDITIGGREHVGYFIAFVPLSEDEGERSSVVSQTKEGLLEAYNLINRK